MDQNELRKLLNDLESDRSERTVSREKTDKFGEAICAFANDMPGSRQDGYLFIGVQPDGRPSGEKLTEDLLQRLAGLRSDGNLLPPPAMTVSKVELDGADIAVVQVRPSDLPPVRYKGRVFIRVGPRRAIATEAEERILAERRTALARTWDARPCGAASLDDLALDLFALNYRLASIAPEVIAENGRSIDLQLAALRLYDLRAACPTNAGVLLLAKDPLSFVVGGYVQFVRYHVLSLDDEPVGERRFAGDLLTVMRGLDELAQVLAVAHPRPAEGLAERLAFEYPPIALHELLMNAVIHRSYESSAPIRVQQFEDRVEILSPGGLYGDLTPDEFRRMTAYRNPVVAEAARVLGFVNRYGRGITRADAELRRNGNPPAAYDPRANHFLVTVGRAP